MRKALVVLETVADMQPVGVAEVSRALGLPKSSVQRSLLTLKDAGWIRPVGSEVTRWEITSKALQVGQYFRGADDLRQVALPIMNEVRAETDETVHLMVPDGQAMVLVERLMTHRPIRVDIPVGRSIPMHTVSNGKAYLALLDETAVESYIAHGLDRSTTHTITDPETLRAELKAIRARGYAVNHGEWRSDVRAVASAIEGGTGGPVGSISISTPPDRMRAAEERRYAALVVDAARRIGASLTGPARR
ncbi:IclR family transcriptional regulator [Streptomyces sp. NPDC050560]|uniref:IclR family transcriptional regulator n=1 Tax=Streptomyces sp. NPDC050560 TaxID=3365630 RepID=UPI0037B70862